MCSVNRVPRLTSRFAPWLGLALGVLICSEPLIASALGFKPPRRGIPGRREGGGVRDGAVGADPCSSPSAPQFAALMPPTNFGLTTTEFPRFFWSTPRTKARFAEFTLHEAVEGTDKKMSDRGLVYRTTFRINGDAGIASLPLPRNSGIPGLAVGQDYHWSIALICNPQDRKKDAKVEGWAQRIAPDANLAKQLAQSSPGDRPKSMRTMAFGSMPCPAWRICAMPSLSIRAWRQTGPSCSRQSNCPTVPLCPSFKRQTSRSSSLNFGWRFDRGRLASPKKGPGVFIQVLK